MPNSKSYHKNYSFHTVDENEIMFDEFENGVDGEEDGVERVEDGILMTPFNMQDELKHGQFDKNGYYTWNKNKNDNDNWIESIDWKNLKDKRCDQSVDIDLITPDYKTSSNFNELDAYRQLLEYMHPNECVSKTLKRLGSFRHLLSNTKGVIKHLTSRKFRNISEKDSITNMTELANNILHYTGNTDIYQQTYEEITEKISSLQIEATLREKKDVLDLFSEDFVENERLLHEFELILK